MAFPMGLGAGAASWLKLPQLPLPKLAMPDAPAQVEAIEPVSPPASDETNGMVNFPDFSAMHPLVVGSFSLLLCSGILLAADGTKRL
jgi:hypothetical protein